MTENNYIFEEIDTSDFKQNTVMEENTNIWWLNEESEQMLNRGYLLKRETV